MNNDQDLHASGRYAIGRVADHPASQIHAFCRRRRDAGCPEGSSCRAPGGRTDCFAGHVPCGRPWRPAKASAASRVCPRRRAGSYRPECAAGDYIRRAAPDRARCLLLLALLRFFRKCVARKDSSRDPLPAKGARRFIHPLVEDVWPGSVADDARFRGRSRRSGAF